MYEDPRDFRDLYERATDFGKPAFAERPFFGGPAAPAQAETNTSDVWGHVNAGYLIGYEYTRWWKESRALRNDAILGDWSWLGKAVVRGPDASAFVNYATVKDLSEQDVGQIMFTPMVNADGKLAIEGLTFRLGPEEYMFTQSGAMAWLSHLRDVTGMDVELEDVTPEYTVYALQGPKSPDVLEAVTGERYDELDFSRFRRTELFDTEVLVDRQGVTGEVGYEFLMRTDTGRAHELWREIREVGRDYGLRELGLRAQMIGHTEAGYATALRDYFPARMPPEELPRFVRHWYSEEELDALEWDPAEQFCSPAELGWAGLIDLDAGDFHGREALVAEADAGGPDHRFVGLVWDGEEVGDLFADQFRDDPAAPPPELASGPFRSLFLEVSVDGERVGWASGVVYSPNFRRMLSNGRLLREHAEAGTEVTVEWGGFSTEPTRGITAEVVDQPMVDQPHVSG